MCASRKCFQVALALLSTVLIASPADVQKRVPVDHQLILMADGSISVDDAAFLIQAQDYDKALRHPDIWYGISSGIPWQIAMTFEDKDVAGQSWGKSSVGPKSLIGLPSRRYGRVVLRRTIRG
jgi:hypothetical protein